MPLPPRIDTYSMGMFLCGPAILGATRRNLNYEHFWPFFSLTRGYMRGFDAFCCQKPTNVDILILAYTTKTPFNPTIIRT